ncbi:hypothetical protein [Legionella bononiensis]|uniref:Coiled-coil protein n=1 Tax=Legionella bononiensis TaxID=2793102 RepID=A0ABS1WG61_9GAMM|nr:hypothetical protein [Legionella bononiensis]MBL7481793.1 hypothetical protein [Legionella bononiensis]MBL7528342.1 hypothetical protein [Legionella bononiensis]MBL7564305.1 hypothetical protein [Legionella bononiensis]
MGLDNDVKEDELDKARAIELLKAMQTPIDYQLVPLTKKSLLRAAAARIPWLSKISLKVDDAADTAIRIGERVSNVNDSFGNESIAHGFHYAVLVMAAIDFVRIPLIYLAAYLLDEKIPFKLSNNARWIYSAFLLGLTITALAAPVTAPVIAFIGAGTGLVFGTFLLARTLNTRYQLGKERKFIQGEIAKAEELMKLLQDDAKELEHKLATSTGDEFIALEIKGLEERYESQKSLIYELKNKELHLEQKIDRVGMMRVFDKSIGVGLTSLSIIGLVVTLFFPPVGGWILAGAAIAGGVYLTGRLLTPVVKHFGNWLMNQFTSSKESVEPESKEDLAHDNTLNEQKEAVMENSSGLKLAVSNVIASDSQSNMSQVTHGELLDEAASDIESNHHTASQHLEPEQGETIHQVDSTALVLVGLMGKKAAIEYSEHLHTHPHEVTNESELDTDFLIAKPKPKPEPEVIAQAEVDDREDEGESEAVGEHP